MVRGISSVETARYAPNTLKIAPSHSSKMAKLRHPRTAPPGNFIYTQMETQHRLGADTLAELVEFVRQHREWRNLARQHPDEVRDDIERQLCMAAYPEVCQAEPDENYVPIKDMTDRVTPDMVMEATKVTIALFQRGELVSKVESNRRANICRGCPLNKRSSCLVCSPLYAAVAALIPSDRKEGGLESCAVCGCSNAAKILVPMDILKEAEQFRGLTYPAYCWTNQSV